MQDFAAKLATITSREGLDNVKLDLYAERATGLVSDADAAKYERLISARIAELRKPPPPPIKPETKAKAHNVGDVADSFLANLKVEPRPEPPVEPKPATAKPIRPVRTKHPEALREAWIKRVLRDPELKHYMTRVLTALSTHFNWDEGGKAWPKQQLLAEESTTSQTLVSRAVNQAARRGYLTIERVPGRSSSYTLILGGHVK